MYIFKKEKYLLMNNKKGDFTLFNSTISIFICLICIKK